MIGSLVAPIIGTVLGGAMGALLGSFVAKEPLPRREKIEWLIEGAARAKELAAVEELTRVE